MRTVDAFIRYADGSVEPLCVVAIPERRLFTLPEPELPPPPAVSCDICDQRAVWWDEWSKYCARHRPAEGGRRTPHRQERGAVSAGTLSAGEALCENCERAPVFARGRCSACYQYRRVNGRERPAHLFDRAHVAVDEADLRDYCQGVRMRLEAGEVEAWRVTQPCGFCDRPIPAGGMGYCHECEMEMGV